MNSTGSVDQANIAQPLGAFIEIIVKTSYSSAGNIEKAAIVEHRPKELTGVHAKMLGSIDPQIVLFSVAENAKIYAINKNMNLLPPVGTGWKQKAVEDGLWKMSLDASSLS